MESHPNMGKLSIIKILGHVLHSSLFVVEGPLKPGILQRIFRSVQFLPEPRNQCETAVNQRGDHSSSNLSILIEKELLPTIL